LREPRAHAEALAAAEVVKAGVTPLLKFLPGAPADPLRPRPEDYVKVFVPEAVEPARDAYEKLWEAKVQVEPLRPGQSDLRIAVAPAGMFREDNELSRKFPVGYRGIAHLLKPERVWVAWKYANPGESSGMAYDGLVWCDDHWVWFPKPYRFVGR